VGCGWCGVRSGLCSWLDPQDEFRKSTTRLALGAEIGRIVRQLMVESVVLSIVGGIAGAGTRPTASEEVRSVTCPNGRSLTLGY
jgi:hypothetical protein